MQKLKEKRNRAAIVALLIVASVASAGAQSPDTLRVGDSTHAADGLRTRTDSLPISIGGPVMVKVHPGPTCGNGTGDVATRRTAVGAVFVGGNAALYSYFKRAWWSGERAPHFFFRADWDENFRDQDKFGHMTGGYHLARTGDALLKSACMSPKKALIWSAAYAWTFQLQIEIWDGLYKKYGFSYADMIANTTGMSLAVLHELHPKTLAIKPTFSYWPSPAMRNANNIPGEVRPSLDYTGQTYWFSADVNALLPESAKPYWPSFLRISAGHGITDWIDPRTGANIRARRKILLSLDFDAEKLPGDNRIWKTVKHNLSYIHFPAPTLQLTPKFLGVGFYK